LFFQRIFFSFFLLTVFIIYFWGFFYPFFLVIFLSHFFLVKNKYVLFYQKLLHLFITFFSFTFHLSLLFSFAAICGSCKRRIIICEFLLTKFSLTFTTHDHIRQILFFLQGRHFYCPAIMTEYWYHKSLLNQSADVKEAIRYWKGYHSRNWSDIQGFNC
jgi:hypothetical protein